MTNIFDKIDKIKVEKILYPQKIIPFLIDFFNEIDIEFNPSENLQDQINGRTKEEYEKLLLFLYREFFEIEKLREKDSSIRFIISKILENYLFKNLEIIYSYNLYHDIDKRNIRKQLERALDYIYEINLETPNYILWEEIDTLVVDWDIYKNQKEINKLLKTSIKKSKFIYSLRKNIEYNKARWENSEKLKEVLDNLESKELEKPEEVKIFINNVKKVISKDFLYETDKYIEIVKSFLLSQNPYYLTNENIIKERKKDDKIIFSLNLNTLVRTWYHTLFNKELDLQFDLSDHFLNYYDSLLVDWFIRRFTEDEDRSFTIKKEASIFRALVDSKSPSLIPLNKYGEVKNYKRIIELEVNWRIYTDLGDIYLQLINLEDEEIFKVTFEDKKTILWSKDLNYFYLLNRNLIESITISESKISLLWDSIVYLKPKFNKARYFNEYISKFLEYEYEDYQYEYQDLKVIDILTKKFTKNDIIKYSREYKTRIDKFEKDLNFSKLIPKWLYD